MAQKITDPKLRNAKPKPNGKPNNITVEEGLVLIVKSDTKKYWRFNYSFGGKRKTLALGVYPAVTLKEVRERYQEACELKAKGIDPAEYKKAQKALKVQLTKNSFEAVAREYYQKYLPTWQPSYSSKMMGYFEKDVFPWLGSNPITDIEAPDIVRIVQRLDNRGAGGAARKVKQHIQQVFDYALAVGMVSRNPAKDIKISMVLKPRQVRHFASIKEPYRVGELMRVIDGFKGQFATCCALKLASLTMLRPGELLNGQWSEINFDEAMWEIPVKRMKAPTYVKEANLTVHHVPLSEQALTILKELYPLTGAGKGGYLFPSIRTTTKPMSNGTINAALRRMGYTKDEMTGHGFRSMASTLLNEMKTPDGFRRWDKDVIERQLAHVDQNTIRDIYNHAQYLNERRLMLQAWADYLDELKEGGQVMPFKAKTKGE